MKMDKLVLLIAVFPFALFGQKMNLEACINYAVKQSNQLKNKVLDIELTEIDQKQARWNYLPNMNGGATHGYNWGQSIDPFTNQFATNRVRTNNLYLSSSWSLFNGLKNYHLLKKAQFQQEFEQYNYEVEKRNLAMDIAAAYLEAYLTAQIIDIRAVSFNQTTQQRDRIKTLYELQYHTQNDYLQIAAKCFTDSANVLAAQSDYDLALLRLQQRMNWQTDNDAKLQIELEAPNTVANSTQVIDASQFPEVKALEAQAKISEHELAQNRARSLPSLSVNASLGSGFSGNNLEIVDGNLQAKPFVNQLDENFYQTASLSLNIPIFNNWQNGAQMQRTKIEMQRIANQQTQTKTEILFRIEQLQIETQNLKMRKMALEGAENASSIAFETAKVKFELGTIKLIDFQEAQNQLLQAQIERNQVETEWLFKRFILVVLLV